jgi:Flp pilus assembly protein TadG
MTFRHRLVERLRRGAADTRGAVAVQFAFLALPLVVLVFGMVDLNRISVQRRQLQDALDAATLMAARSTAVTDPALDTVGDAAFAAEMAGQGVTLTKDSSSFKSGVDSKVLGSADVTLKPIIANLWMKGDLPVNVTSEVMRSVTKLEVALVLDNTQSMDSNLGGGGKKITALKTAAQSLVDILSAAAARATESDAVKIGVVPFSMTVNVGPTYKTADWIAPTLPASYSPVGTPDTFDSPQNRFTLLTRMGLTWSGCVESRPDPYDISDDAPDAGVPNSLFVPYFAPDEPDSGKSTKPTGWGGFTVNNSYITKDTTGSETDWFKRQAFAAKYGTANQTSAANDVDGGPNEGCGLTSLMRLTNVRAGADATKVKTKLNAMIAVGNTNVAMGLIWGWHLISPNAPFKDGSAYGTKNVKKIIVLLTDGDNTNTGQNNPNDSLYSGYGYIWQKRLKNANGVALTSGSSDNDRRDAMDSRQARICAAAKASGKDVFIYAIGVGVSAHSRTILQACATSPEYYYDVTDAAQLKPVFDAIAGSIQNLRIAK